MGGVGARRRSPRRDDRPPGHAGWVQAVRAPQGESGAQCPGGGEEAATGVPGEDSLGQRRGLRGAASSGIVCFDVEGMSAGETVDRLDSLGFVATVTPYATTHARLAPSVLNLPEEIDAAIAAVREIAS